MKMDVSLLLMGFALLLAPSLFAQQGIPQTLLNELPPYFSLPKGSYQLLHSWEGEQDFSHNGGEAVEDAQASDGKAWLATSKNSQPGVQVIFGPYAEIPAGDYIAFFRLKLLGEAGDEPVATLDACVDYAKTMLNSVTIYGSDLPLNRYAFVPLPFHYDKGKLECRVGWAGNASLMIDKIELYRVEGGDPADFRRKIVPQPVPSGEPRNLDFAPKPRPFPALFPRSQAPADKLIVCDLRNVPSDWQLAIIALQGLVNRKKPQIYLLLQPTDQLWLDWMLQRGWIKGTEEVKEPAELLRRFRDEVKGGIVIDPRLPATKNIATMLASVEDALPLSPRLAKELNLPILEDLRGRWKKSLEAYQWAYDNLWRKMNHSVLACLYPDHLWLRDYLVENKIFIFWLPGRIDGAELYSSPEEEIRFGEQLLAKVPPNIPIMGYPWAGVDVGMGEGPGVTLFSELAKFLVGSINCSNLSVHSGISILKLNPPTPPPPPPLDKNKVYVSFIISDGDNLPVLTAGNFPQLWQDKTRGRFPIGWTMSPSAHILIPAVVDYYYTTATPNDAFLTAVSGIGYCYPDSYAIRYKQREKVFDEFLDLTAEHMGIMGLKMAWIMGITRPELIARYAERIPNLQAIFPDYGKRVNDYADATYLTAKNVPVFHAVTGWKENASREEQISNIVSQVRSITPTQRPAFLHIFVCNWFFDIPMLEEILKQLGPEYVAVRPDHLALLYKQYAEEEKLSLLLPSLLVGIRGQPIFFSFPLRNTSSKRLMGGISVEGLGKAWVKPDRFSLSPAQMVKVDIKGTPAGERVKVTVKSGAFSLSRELPIRLIQQNELISPLPPKITLRFVRHLEAETLAHNTGKRMEDASASNGIVWVAGPGDAGSTHMLFGPYMPLDKGTYLALFRLKRLGEGQGRIATLDTCVGGGQPTISARDLLAEELPLGEFRYVPLSFQHPGGAVETRVFWYGNVPLAVDCVDIFEILKE